MTQLRFVKTPEQLIEAAENNLEFFDANMQAIKAWYKTEPGLIEQLIPAPLEPHADPMVRIVISRVFVDLNGGMDFGAATFGVNCMYKGKEGIYEIFIETGLSSSGITLSKLTTKIPSLRLAPLISTSSASVKLLLNALEANPLWTKSLDSSSTLPSITRTFFSLVIETSFLLNPATASSTVKCSSSSFTTL